MLGPGHGHLPPRHVPLLPWDAVAIDLIGPWKAKLQGNDIEFNALTRIDPVTNLVEMIQLENKTSSHVAQQFANVWLSCYPRPNRCIHDNGGVFIEELVAFFLRELPNIVVAGNPQAPQVPQFLTFELLGYFPKILQVIVTYVDIW